MGLISRRREDGPFWQDRLPSLAILAVVLVAIVVTTAGLTPRVLRAMPDVGKDQLGDDHWSDPIGVERKGPFQFGHIPDCAAGPVTRIALWDADSNPFWEVAGPPSPLTSFAVGATPPGFTEVRAYRAPKAGEVLRLVVFRKVGGVAGIRYQTADLRENRVVAGSSLNRFTVSGFQTAQVCGDSKVANDDQANDDQAGGGG